MVDKTQTQAFLSVDLPKLLKALHHKETQMTLTLSKPTTTNTQIFDGKKKKIELLEDLFQAMLKKQPEMSKAKKINHFIHIAGEKHYKHLRISLPTVNEHLKTYSSYSAEYTSDHNHKPKQKTLGKNSLSTLTQKNFQISLKN